MKPPSPNVALRGAVSRFRALPTGRKVTIAAVLLIFIQLVFRGWLIGHSWFLVDDFYFLSDVARGLDNLEWYLHIHQGHFMPFSFLLVKIVGSMGAFNWAAAATEIIVLQLLASLACWWMLRTLFGNRPAILIPLSFYVLSPFTMPSVMWWAVAINQMPNQIACFGAVAAHVKFARSKQWKFAMLAAAFLVLGYLSYTKTILIPVILVLLTVIYFAQGSLVRRCVDAFLGFWKAWLTYAIVTILFIATYLLKTPELFSGKRPSFLDLVGATVLESLGTTLVGGPWRWSPFGPGPISFAAPPEAGIVAAWLLVLSVLVYIWATRERSLRALWLIGFYVAASLPVIYFGRMYAIGLIGGVAIGRQVQYLSDSTPIIVLVLGLMIAPLVGAPESSSLRSRPLLTRRVHPAIVAVFVLTIVVGSIASSLRLAKPWNSDYFERTFTKTATERITADEPLFADEVVPARATDPLAHPRNLIRNYFAPLGESLHTTKIGNDLKVLREDGTIAPAVSNGPVRTLAKGSKKCPFAVEGKETKIPFAPVFNLPFWMAIDYTSNKDSHIPLDYGIYRKDVPIETGRHTLFIATRGGYDSITLTPLVGQRICVRSVRVGGLVPKAAS